MRVNSSATENCFKPRSASLEKKKISKALSYFFTPKSFSCHKTLLQISCNRKWGGCHRSLAPDELPLNESSALEIHSHCIYFSNVSSCWEIPNSPWGGRTQPFLTSRRQLHRHQLRNPASLPLISPQSCLYGQRGKEKHWHHIGNRSNAKALAADVRKHDSLSPLLCICSSLLLHQ